MRTSRKRKALIKRNRASRCVTTALQQGVLDDVINHSYKKAIASSFEVAQLRVSTVVTQADTQMIIPVDELVLSSLSKGICDEIKQLISVGKIKTQVSEAWCGEIHSVAFSLLLND